jgi:2Fe-2S ferredoxin
VPFRLVRLGISLASRATGAAVDRVLRHAPLPPPVRTGVSTRRPETSGACHVRFGAAESRVPRGTTLLEAARAAGVEVRHYCGGNCSCGTCRVEVRGGAEALSRADGMERAVLGDAAFRRGDRLACQAVVRGDVEVHVPDWF